MSATELSRLARVWRAGNAAFKKAFLLGTVDPQTKVIPFHVKPEFLVEKTPEAKEIQAALDECQAVRLTKAVESFATEKTARFIRLGLILCLGETLVKKRGEEEE